ncbi:hypothetical protein BDK63_003142 [Halomonas campaniensis]|uniref:Uncharacterized protein n=1 Tax=Halomonas campaniensis TaxID=213554 RepID=A0A7W5K5B6_9GAMM|nr:hypothetical protein [Halomonas campaniensis]MBB3332248.1 hypothetical protein [Halomonas campaniensis]
MTTQAIKESGMTFGPYPEGQCFYIEKSDTYKSIENGVKIAEFILIKADKGEAPSLWVVEAKSSSPRPETQPNFDDFIEEIREKLINAFSLSLASCLKRHEKAEPELPRKIQELDFSNAGARFILVIKGHEEGWLPPLQEALALALRPTLKTWSFSPTSVAVMNEDLATQHGLILCEQEG